MSASSFLESLFSLTGRVAVVIGGTGELCGAIAEGYAKAGARVVLVGRDPAKAEARLARIHAAGAEGIFIPCEATSKAAVEELLAAVLKQYGRVDILVNGAGVNSPKPFLDIPEEDLDRILSVNYKSVVYACQVFAKHWLDNGQKGAIINLGSVSGVAPLSRVFTYSASKAALHNLSQNLAREWGAKGIRVNILIPGFFPAEQNRKVLTPDRVASILARTPANRFGEASELVGAAILLASDNAGSFITGLEMVVDGGFCAMTI